jgi:FkbM family methyltransferase
MTKNFGKNEERTSEYLKKFNREKVLKLLVDSNLPTILDVGANNGSSLVEFKKWWPNSKVHCFEPQSECWDELDDLSNEFTNVHINKFALGNKNDESKEFYSHDLNTGISGFNKINIESKDSIDLSKLSNDSKSLENHKKTINHKRNVQVKRLDEYIKNDKNINQIDLLKIDTQGYELEILEGLGTELNKVRILITELMFYDYYEKSLSFYELESILRPFNFSLYDINHVAKNPMNGRTDWIDVIYVQNR